MPLGETDLACVFKSWKLYDFLLSALADSQQRVTEGNTRIAHRLSCARASDKHPLGTVTPVAAE